MYVLIVITNFKPLFGESIRDPDVYLYRRAQHLPQLVVECGYADCPDNLNDDLDLWDKGASQYTLVVIIAVWKSCPRAGLQGCRAYDCLPMC